MAVDESGERYLPSAPEAALSKSHISDLLCENDSRNCLVKRTDWPLEERFDSANLKSFGAGLETLQRILVRNLIVKQLNWKS